MVKPNPRVKPGNRNYRSDQDLIGPAKAMVGATGIEPVTDRAPWSVPAAR